MDMGMQGDTVIKTFEEFTHERKVICTHAIAAKYLAAVRPIYRADKNFRPVQEGSCVLIDYRGSKVLITAAHVLDSMVQGPICVLGEDAPVQINGKILVSNKPNDSRDGDKLDIAIVLLSDELVAELKNVYFIPEEEWAIGELSAVEQLCCTLGYPNSKNKKPDASKKRLSPVPFVYTSLLESDRDLYKEVGLLESDHYLLAFSEKHSLNDKNEKVNSVYPKGLSGGGLFVIEGMGDVESFRLDAPCSAKLIGILIEFRTKQDVLVYTKLRTIMYFLRENWPKFIENE